MQNSTNIDFSTLSVDDICNLINNTLSGDNTKITEATKILKAYTKHKSSIKTLTFILVNAPNIGHRQMSTVLLKRNIVNLYIGLEEAEKTEFRDVLLNQYIKETAITIQRGIAALIGLLLPVVELKNWEQLKNLLEQAIQSAPNSVATFVLLNCLLYHFKPPKELYAYLLNALQVPNLIDEALKCIMAVAETQDVDESVAIELIKIWGNSNWHEDISLSCLEVITILAERKIKLGEEIIEFICNNVVANKKLSTKFRVAGMDFLSTYSEFNGKSLANKEKLLKKIIEVICQVCSEPFGQEEQEEGEPVQEIALWFIENMSISIKSKKIYPILLEASIALINAEDINKINTGFLLLGSMAEGCAEKLKKNLQNPVMNVLIPKGLSHASPEVRGAAINALSYFSEFLIPDIVEYHATIIPSMIGHFDDMSSKVAEKALIAVDVFFDNMEEDEIKSYLPVVIPKLSQVVVSDKSTFLMRDVSMSAIGSAVEAARQGFEPFAPNVYAMCLEILKVEPSPQMNSLRSHNITVLAKICNIFCKKDYSQRESFYRSYAMPVMEPIYSILTKETDPEIREACFMFFYLLANAIENDFSSIFDKIIPEVVKSATLKTPERPKKNKDFSLDSDSEDEGVFLNEVQVSEYDEKAAAIRALGELASACPMNFGPYFEQAYKILDDHHQFFYESVRMEVSTCYVNLIKGFVKSQNNGVLPKFAPGLPVLQRYPEQLEKFIKTEIIPKLIFMMTEDDNRRVSSQAIVSMDEFVKALGPAAIDHSLEKICQSIIQLLENQVAEEDDEEENDEDEEDADAYIFEPLCGDLVPTLSDVLQGAFLPYLNEIFPYMSKFLEERENVNENVQMAGCIAQCIKNVPSFFDSRAEELFQSLAGLTEIQDTDLNRNIAFCFAEAIEKAPNSMKNYLEHALLILKNIYEHKDSHQACKDNALAGICRAIIVFMPPMPYEMFVANLIKSMPFKGDEEEEKAAIRCIMHLSQANSTLIQPYIKEVIAILENDLSQPSKYKLEGDLLPTVTNYFQSLKNSQ